MLVLYHQRYVTVRLQYILFRPYSTYVGATLRPKAKLFGAYVPYI